LYLYNALLKIFAAFFVKMSSKRVVKGGKEGWGRGREGEGWGKTGKWKGK
jgi:hypothetical protein